MSCNMSVAKDFNALQSFGSKGKWWGLRCRSPSSRVHVQAGTRATWFWQLGAYLQPLPNTRGRSLNVGEHRACSARRFVGWGLNRVLTLLLTRVEFKHLPLLSMNNWVHYPSCWQRASGGLKEEYSRLQSPYLLFFLCQHSLVFSLIVSPT